MKTVFFGTPDFAVPSLEALIENYNVAAVVSQPDKPKGRGKKVTPTPVKIAAEKHGIPVFQPLSARDSKFLEELETYGADIFVVAAYGQILPKKLLDMPKFGSVNVHGSLLPKYRGAAPIQQAVIDGEKTTGVTIMYMAEKLDSGDMLLKAEIPIESDDTYGSLSDKLADLGANTLIKALKQIEEGSANPVKQDDSLSTYAHKVTKEGGLIDFSQGSEKIVNLIRGYNPSPTAYTLYDGGRMKVYAAKAVKGEFEGKPGEIISAKKKGIIVKTGDEAVCITEIQAPGSKKMSVSAYLLGHKIENGKTFGV
ncbi:MAG: methionyl-tRNA formyltransferase [Clostridiales bacterium]|nr:methionyl-tRNA formyltransferase [Clostridiales bacterium]